MSDEKDDFEKQMRALLKGVHELAAAEVKGKSGRAPKASQKPKPKPQWDHPTLGRFTFDDIAWCNTVKAPAFKAFTYGLDEDDDSNASGKSKLYFDADDESQIPSKEAIALADKVLANQKKLVKAVIDALWTDFNGQGPKTGMWWHGNMEEVGNGLSDADIDQLPESAEDLLALMGYCSIHVRRKPDMVVELSFAAAFEEEHGVGVLTDGTKILGLGYSCDVRPFQAK